jgi:LysR family hydrogen peroxide-inducible transcriptional activator
MGVELAEIGRGMLRDAQQIRDLAEKHRRKSDGSICVGLLQTIGPPLLSRILPALCVRFPHLTLRISEDVPKALLSGLDDGIFDVVLAPLDGRTKGFCHSEVFQEPIYLCLPTGHPLTKRNRVRPADLRGVELLALAARHQLHDVAVELAAKLGVKLRLEYEINTLDTLREMIAANLGASFLPGLYVHSLLPRNRSFKIVEIEGWQLSRSIGMLWRKSSAQSSNYEQLAEFVRGSVQQQFRGMSQRPRLAPLRYKAG